MTNSADWTQRQATVITASPWKRPRRPSESMSRFRSLSVAAGVVAAIASYFAAVGGSMGALCSVLFEEVGRAVVDMDAPFSTEQFVYLLTIAEKAVSEFGGAKRGDKTIIDAIGTARDAAEKCAQEELRPVDALTAAAAAARQGAMATAGMIAQIGRASRLGVRSLGAVDPGAMSVAIVLDALARSYLQDVGALDAQALVIRGQSSAEVDHETAG